MQTIQWEIRPDRVWNKKLLQPRQLLLSLGGLCVLLGVWVPLPSALVDLLLGLSLGASAVLLLLTTRLRQCTQLLCFPSLLLGLTLFRLTLNLSTTRLILGERYAGEMIDAVGKVTLGGHAGVGWVMFALMVAVQFFVVTKGAQRAAEVGARFALDALPGEQAAIDAELRAGRLTMSQATRMRQRLGERCELLGRLDAAMRCVQGDVMVGIVIIGVNLGAGMTMGVVQDGMSLEEAWACFGMLTVGDGLLSQIPALMSGLAAAVMVTKVEQKVSLDPGRMVQGPAEHDVGVWGIPAAGLLGISLCPGLPWWPTLVPGLILAGIGYAVWMRKNAKAIPERLREVAAIHAHPRVIANIRAELEGHDDANSGEVVESKAEYGEIKAKKPSWTLRWMSVAPRLVMQLEEIWGFPAPALRFVPQSQLGDRIVVQHGPVRLFELDAVGFSERGSFRRRFIQALGQHRAVFLSRAIVQAAFLRLREQHGALVDEVLNVLEVSDGVAIARAFACEGLRLPPMEQLMAAWLDMPVKVQRASRKESYAALRRRTRACWLSTRWQEIQQRKDLSPAIRLKPDFADTLEVGMPLADGEGAEPRVDEETARKWVEALLDEKGRARAYVEVERSSTRIALQSLFRDRGWAHYPVLSRSDLRGLGPQDPGPAPLVATIPGGFWND